MDTSCIYIDGAVLWVVIAILVVIVGIALFCSICSIALQDENYILRDKLRKSEEDNEDLRLELSKTQHKLYSKQYTDNLKSLEVE